MSILKPIVSGQFEGSSLTVQQLELLLNPNSAATLRQLLHVLNAPPDTPRLLAVLQSSREAVARYGMTLTRPSATFHLVKISLQQLCDDVDMITKGAVKQCELERPLMRRLTEHSPYALALTFAALCNSDIGVAWEAAGIEIALGLATTRKFPGGLANQIRRTLTPELFNFSKDSTKRQTSWAKSYVKRRVQAAKLFEVGGPSSPESTNCVRLFDINAKHELARKTCYAPPRQRQAILDRRHQTNWQLRASAATLLAQAIQHDHTALLTLVAFSSGLSLRLTMNLPLIDRVDDDEWLMVLDLGAGVIKTNLDPLFPKSAMPRPGSMCFRAANRIIVKPLPAFLWCNLKELHAANPGAETLAQLLPDAAQSGRQLTLLDDDSALAPSVRRFLVAAGPLAVNLGIDRLSAALLANDFAVIPSSKLYYCRARREELWTASEILFDELGWGKPAPLLRGMPVGSRIVPSRQAILDWHRWMVTEMAALAPGRHCMSQRLIIFHNHYSRLCASFAVLCLAAREVRELKFTTHNLRPGAKFAAFNDKQVGIFPGDLKVPINRLLRMQLGLWTAHCRVLRRRLERLGLPGAIDLLRTLDRFLSGESQALFFNINPENFQITPLGSAALIKWWPEEYRFSGDFGRHFWEVELRDADVRSTRIDVLLRHVTLGVEAHCSTYGDKLGDIAAEINFAQEGLLESLGIRPIAGLIAKGDHQ